MNCLDFCKKLVILFIFFSSFCQCRKVAINGFDAPKIYKTAEADSNFLKSVATDGEYYPYSKSNEGYEQAGIALKNPLLFTIENLERGKSIYVANCQHCHGAKGKSDAPMILKNKFPPPPNYTKRIKTITEGKMFHSIFYGKNLMPSFRNDLTASEKWQVIFYVQKLAKE